MKGIKSKRKWAAIILIIFNNIKSIKSHLISSHLIKLLAIALSYSMTIKHG